MAAARKPSETFNPYSGVIFIELFTLPLLPYIIQLCKKYVSLLKTGTLV
jgi:hypothetical protein